MTSEERTEALAALITNLIKLAFGIVAFIGSCFLDGFVLKTMWVWFVVGTFNVPALTLSIAMGLTCVATLLFWQKNYNAVEYQEGEEHYFGKFAQVFSRTIAVLFIFGLGAAIHFGTILLTKMGW